MKTFDSLRKNLVLSFFLLFSFFVCISVACIYLLFKGSIVSMDQSQALADLRLVSMYMDFQSQGEWAVRNGSLFKGDILVTDNRRIAAELSRYLRPGTRASFHTGTVPDNVASLLIDDSGFVMQLINSLKKNDRRFNLMQHPDQGAGASPPPLPEFPDFGAGPPPVDSMANPSGLTGTFILPGGIVHVIRSGNEEDVGWIQLERESLGEGDMEAFVFWTFLAFTLLFSSFILYIAWRVMFRLVEPVRRLEIRHKEVVDQKKSLEDISRRDPLTGLLNRRGFDASLRGQSFLADGRHAAVALLDLDDFKKINDKYGHPCGDYVLKEVARIITRGIRQGDIACRWGGEEILVFFSGAEDGLLSEMVERMRQAVADHPYSFGELRLTVTATIGFSPCLDLSDFPACVERADKALYRGKKEGKNRIVRG